MKHFSIEGFAQGCKQAMANADDKREAARQFMQQTIETFPTEEIIAVLEAAVPAGANLGELIVYNSAEITLLYGRVPPHFQSGIHNHTVCAVIGQLTGCEINTFYERREDGNGLREIANKTLNPGDVIYMKKDAIHRIENPLNETGKALHVYAGDFSAVMGRRSLWSSDAQQEKSFNFKDLLAESVKGMQLANNQQGLDEIVKAMPETAKLIQQNALS